MNSNVTKESIFENVLKIVKSIGEERINGEINLETLLTTELGFNSVDLMDVMIAIQDLYWDESDTIDVGEFMQCVFKSYENSAVSAKSLADTVIKFYNL